MLSTSGGNDRSCRMSPIRSPRGVSVTRRSASHSLKVILVHSAVLVNVLGRAGVCASHARFTCAAHSFIDDVKRGPALQGARCRETPYRGLCGAQRIRPARALHMLSPSP